MNKPIRLSSMFISEEERKEKAKKEKLAQLSEAAGNIVFYDLLNKFSGELIIEKFGSSKSCNFYKLYTMQKVCAVSLNKNPAKWINNFKNFVYDFVNEKNNDIITESINKNKIRLTRIKDLNPGKLSNIENNITYFIKGTGTNLKYSSTDLKLKEITLTKGIEDFYIKDIPSLKTINGIENVKNLNCKSIIRCGIENLFVKEKLNIREGLVLDPVTQSLIDIADDTEKSIRIPDGVIELNISCKNCTELYIPQSVKFIKKVEVKKLNNLIIPEGVLEISENAFKECKIKNLIISKGVKRICSTAFSYTKIDTVKLPAQIKEFMPSSFFICDINKIIVPFYSDSFYHMLNDEIFIAKNLKEKLIDSNTILEN